MKRLLITMLIMLFVVPVSFAEDFKFMPATTEHIMATAKAMKADTTLKVLVLTYSAKIDYKNIDDMIDSARAVEDAYLYVDININRIVIGVANKNGKMEKEYKFKTDGVYIKLFHE